MKIIRAIAAIAFFAAISAATVAAQPKPGATSTPARPGPVSSAPATAGSTTGNVPEAKVALVDTEAFLDEKVGIQRLIAAAKKLEGEFQPRRTEIQNLQAQVDKLTADLQKAAQVQDPKVTAQQQEAIETKKRDITRKTEDAQTAYQGRMTALLAPVYEEIS